MEPCTGRAIDNNNRTVRMCEHGTCTSSMCATWIYCAICYRPESYSTIPISIRLRCAANNCMLRVHGRIELRRNAKGTAATIFRMCGDNCHTCSLYEFRLTHCRIAYGCKSKSCYSEELWVHGPLDAALLLYGRLLTFHYERACCVVGLSEYVIQ